MKLSEALEVLVGRIEQCEAAIFRLQTERSGAAQRCRPSATGSAPERSGGAETGDDYLRRSAPVERFSALVQSWKEQCEEATRIRNTFKRCDHEYDHWDGIHRGFFQCSQELEQLIAENSGQRSAPKAESVAPDEGGSGAQARNADIRHGG